MQVNAARGNQGFNREGIDYTAASFVNRWKHGLVRRPFHFYIGDEDPVSTGVDYIGVLAGTPNGRPLNYFGFLPVQMLASCEDFSELRTPWLM